MLQPLPFRDGHGSYLTVSIAPLTRPALPTPIPQASSRRSTSCSSRQPHKPKLLPFAASVAFPLKRGCPQGGGLGVFTSANEASSASSRVSSPSRPDNYLSLRRADDGSVNSAVVCSLRYSPSSGRPAAPATPSPKGYTKNKACCTVVGRAVSHPQNAYSAHLRGQYQQPHPVRKPPRSLSLRSLSLSKRRSVERPPSRKHESTIVRITKRVILIFTRIYTEAKLSGIQPPPVFTRIYLSTFNSKLPTTLNSKL